GNRIGHVHLKDLRKNVFEKVKKEDLSFLDSIREGVFTVPGDGMIDFVPIFKFLESIDYHGWMVVEAEQDPAKANPLEYALKARSYIKSSAGF
ncbi:MAG: TIM barrel protein, partial [Sphaerochaetaceae bacterium]